MADLTKAQLAARILEHLGVKSATDGADASDQELAEEAIDSAHERLRKYGLAPFATSAIPPWAQVALRDYVAGDIAQTFGKDDPKWKQGQAMAERELAKQTSGSKPPLAIRADYF